MATIAPKASSAGRPSAGAGDQRRPEKSMGENNAVKAYLVAYNVSQMLGWLVLMVKIVDHLVRERSSRKLYAEVEPVLQIFQTAAVLEILHSAVGFVKSNPVLTGVQVFSRVFLVWGVVWSVPQVYWLESPRGIVSLANYTLIIPLLLKVQTTNFIIYFLVAWTVTEIIRYSFYFFSLLGHVPYPLKWCRYTFFILLYPIGVMGEVMTIYLALPHVLKSGLYTFPLPNPANMAFNYYYYLWFILFSYLPVFPQLYGHMLKQRRKIISTPQHSKQA